MAYVTARAKDTWEIRESVSTPDGPRSRTLASFRTLSDDVVEHALARATKPLDAEAIHAAARRAGAPIELAAADRAAADLLRELADGHEPHPILRSLLIEALRADPPARLGEQRREAPSSDTAEDLPFESSDNARASAAWLTRTPKERGAALHDLLLLADQFPSDRRAGQDIGFPRLDRAA
jgi:hypothetical protein